MFSSCRRVAVSYTHLVVKALICAAKNGKKVTVVIELLASFDEASNLNWSKRMQDAGIRVILSLIHI